ncbi:hypothetical protein PsYK624_041890 [Phanerochaete sordida]|uniref:DUF6697 domain-containing protein n=1 Tax=Phanerochaete sordida TaxID=48140 RepID=A0A9P3LA82_9APHY|nr:hypothetical protein PsYK624_041890 [Phanerochaete sordida]
MAERKGLGSPLLSRTPSAQGQVSGIYPAAGRRGLASPSQVYLDQLRVTEALLARDYAINQMEGVCASNRAKEAVIAQLRHEKENLEAKLAAGSLIGDMDTECCKDNDALRKSNAELHARLELLSLQSEGTPAMTTMLSPTMQHELLSPSQDTPRIPSLYADAEPPEAIMQARFAVLADLPTPSDLPNDCLVPILIPTPFSLQDFLATVTGSLRIHLANYRIFQESTTRWGPEREEHGYYLTPAFKCSTNPRVVTAHRWHAIDLESEFNRPTECFFNRQGKWYYAGVYKTFRLQDIAPQEWAKLPAETTQALVKETIAHRKNVSPQTIYEVGQLYAAGALKAACVGLQCIGFNDALYHGLLAQADVCAKTGHWRGPPVGVGLGTGAIWNANAGFGQSLMSTGAAGAGGDAGADTGPDDSKAFA